MEFLLGIEPVVALGVGIAALAIAPVIGALGNSEVSQKVSETGRDMTKQGVKFGMETFENVQSYLAVASESWNDLIAEAQFEMKNTKKAQVKD